MRFWGMLLLGAGIAAAETPPAAAVVQGVLLERDAQTAAGQFSVRRADNQVFRYQFDAKTYVLRETQLIDVSRIRPGEKVEVVSDTIPGYVLRYARTVHVLEDAPPRRPASLARARSANRLADDRYLPAGNLTYSGVVLRISGERILVHMRDGRDQPLILRRDTRYLQNGEIVDAAALKLNTRVFVRAGKDLWDEIEAYQIVWGRILEP